MRAIYLSERRLSLRENYQPPQPAAAEALLQLRLAGICATDLELVNGYYPFEGVLGHEFVADVVACDSDPAWVGRRVVGSINISPHCNGSCGLRCPEHCPERTVLGIVNKDGAFADYLTLPVANLHAVPDNVSDEQAVFTEPLAAALRIGEQLTLPDRVALIGPGRLGLLIAQSLRHAGSAVTLFGRSQRSLQLPLQLGFDTRLTAGRAEFDLVVEATANPSGFAQALQLVRPGGVIVLKSTYSGASVGDFNRFAELLATVVVNEVTLVGSRCGPFAPALTLLAANAIAVTPLIEARYPLKAAAAAFDHAARPGVRKILLHP